MSDTKVSNEISIEKIKTYLTDNVNTEEVKGMLNEFTKPTTDLIDKFIKEDEVWKKWGQSFTDKRVTDGIQTAINKYEKEKLALKIQEAENKVREELMPKITPEQKELSEMRKKQLETDKLIQKQALENFAIKEATARDFKRIDSLLDLFVAAGNEDLIREKLNVIIDYGKSEFERGRNIALKEGAYRLEDGDNEKPAFVTLKDYDAYLKRTNKKFDPELYRKIVAYENRRK